MSSISSAVIGSVLIAAAAVVHLVFFAMESMLWSSPGVWRRFGMSSQRDADIVHPMAYNQGFYNLFLAGGSVVGLVLYWTTLRQVGFGLIFFCGVCMVLASLVLVTTDRRFRGAAVLQGGLPLLGLILFVVADNL
jgi:putative membrane protein